MLLAHIKSRHTHLMATSNICAFKPFWGFKQAKEISHQIPKGIKLLFTLGMMHEKPIMNASNLKAFFLFNGKLSTIQTVPELKKECLENEQMKPAKRINLTPTR